MPIQSGIPAPDFKLLDDTNTLRKLSEFRGRNVVLYFYPKDDTPGCTKEACNFRDDCSAYEKAGGVLGASSVSPASHAKFKRKFGSSVINGKEPRREGRKVHKGERKGFISLFFLRAFVVKNGFPLKTVDPKISITFPFMEKSYEGVLRTTFLIDAEGVIRKVYENVRPAEHSARLLGNLGLV